MRHKENLLNLAVEAVPPEFDKLIWIDSDIWFMSNDWASRTESALQERAVAQLFSDAVWTDQGPPALLA